MTPCSIHGCPTTSDQEYVTSGDDGVTRCRTHHLAALQARRATEEGEVCALLVRRPNEWLAKWGTPEGREQWIADDLASRIRGYSPDEINWRTGKPKRPPSRGPSAATYARVRANVEMASHYEDRGCALGHPCRTTASVLGMDMLGGGFRQIEGPIRCIHQSVCRDYEAHASVAERVAAMAPREEREA